MALRTFSYGGGVQSTACLVLAARGVIDFPTFLFANVGDDSEHPATLRYVREIAAPYAAEHGIVLEVPPKSSCWFCPYTKASEWQRRRHSEPEIFWQAVELERTLQKRREGWGRDAVYLCKHGRNLDEFTSDEEQLSLLGDQSGSDCETGYCMT